MKKQTAAQTSILPEQMQQTLLEYQAILENASVGILFTRDRRVLHCNPRFSEIFGWPHGELVGQPGSVFYLSDADYATIGRIAGPILSSGGLLRMWANASMPRHDCKTCCSNSKPSWKMPRSASSSRTMV